MTGLTSTIGILSAVHERSLSGKGQHVDVSLFDVGIACMANIAQSYLATGEAPGRIGNAHPQVAPYQDFTASDGNFMTAANNDDQFKRMCEAVGKPELADDQRFLSNADRVKNRKELEILLNHQFMKNPKSHWMTVLQESGLTVTSINTLEEVFKDPQAEARKSVWQMDHPHLGKIDLLGSALQHLSRTPPQPTTTPPILGEHTNEVMKNVLGMNDEEIKELTSSEVIKGNQ